MELIKDRFQVLHFNGGFPAMNPQNKRSSAWTQTRLTLITGLVSVAKS